MSERDMQINGLAYLIEIVTAGEWSRHSNATMVQAIAYVDGFRDDQIADVTFQAATLARMIGR